MFTPKYEDRRLRVLAFDIENRPLNYAGPDFTQSDITAIACKLTDVEDEPICWLDADGHYEQSEMLAHFYEWYCAADIVTGHYIRRHDLGLINGALIEHGLDPLPAKMTQDTCLDLRGKMKGVSKSLENLAEMFGLEGSKMPMSQVKWRAGNRKQEQGLEWVRRRVTTDVDLQIAVRAELLRRNLLSKPKMWSPG
jgi:hypothetical protein